ncbi:asparagine synthase C-terminal domain-containing protein, partial [Verrucomicrobia bacterium]|nr:asparagine synthase C-terminal domain-containing protein [Verrucomicrobiota bacterium]
LTRRIKKLFRGANLDGDERITNYFKWLPKDQILPLFSKDIRETLESKNAAEPMIDFLSPMPKQVKHFERMLALEQRFFLTDHNLTYTDKMAMAVGVEVRVPFLDLELVDYAASISSRLKQRGSCGKWILKKAMENYLPHDIIYRPKSGFGAPLVEWLSHDFKDLLSDLLSEESVNNRGIFDYQGIQALRHKSSSGRLDCSYVLLTLVCVEIWLRKFYD